MKKSFLFLLLILLFTQCKKTFTETPSITTTYLPPNNSTTWETVSPASLNWNEAELTNLYSYLQQKNTKAFIVLKNGRIAAEKYFGTFKQDSVWYWASAGKTMTAFLVGIAQSEGKLNLDYKTSQYLGTGWTALPTLKENNITIRHQLSMTTGLDDGIGDTDCTLPACLQYKADASTRWAYHNAPYTLLEKVVESATGVTYNQYFKEKIRDKIGMNGAWIKTGYNNVYFSTPRSMARFGLLLLNEGKWNNTAILADNDFFKNQVNSSQNFNPSYGYLTWLNGKKSYMLPQLQLSLDGALIPAAPADTYAALGKNDQKIYMVPSQNMVVIRMGESAGNAHLALSSFDNELWGKLRLVMNQ